MEEMAIMKLAEFGFPSILCFYLIFRLNNTLADLTKAIEKSNSTNDEVKADIREIKSDVKELKMRGAIAK